MGVLGLVLMGNVARRWVQRNLSAPGRHPRPCPWRARRPDRDEPGPPGPGSWHCPSRPVVPDVLAVSRLRRGLALEVVIAAAVLSLTAALVVIVPAGQDFGSAARPGAGAPETQQRPTLSCGPLCSRATPTGLEPATSAVTGRRANQLRYGA